MYLGPEVVTVDANLPSFYGGLMGFNGIDPLVNIQKLWDIIIFNGKIIYLYGHVQ